MNTVLFVLDLLINTLWQAALIALAVWTVFRFRPRINAATRHAIWWCTLAVILILPFTRQIASVVQPSRPPGTTFRRVQDTVKTTSAAAPEVVVLRLPASPESRWPGLLVFLWMAIALSRLMQLVRSYFYFRRVRRRAMASPIRLPHLKRVAIVLISPEIESPMAVGFRPPAVLLPASSIGNLSEEQREHILLHEAAHLAAYDDWTNLLLRFLRALLNLHPVAIGIIRQIECERELACDDWVVERTGSARPYARTLAHMLEAGSAFSRAGTRVRFSRRQIPNRSAYRNSAPARTHVFRAYRSPRSSRQRRCTFVADRGRIFRTALDRACSGNSRLANRGRR